MADGADGIRHLTGRVPGEDGILIETKRLEGHPMQKITPFLWFDDKAEEAAKFYV
jgi:hypothetical protein